MGATQGVVTGGRLVESWTGGAGQIPVIVAPGVVQHE
mgnify:CR=1 FL=1